MDDSYDGLMSWFFIGPDGQIVCMLSVSEAAEREG